MQNVVHPVLGVLGGSGGVGASSFAAVLAWAAATRSGGSLLLDADAAGGGVDVLLGLEREPGARWSGVRLDGGHLEPELLLGGLVRVGSCAVLAADVPVDADAAVQVVAVAVGGGPVVVDLPRGRGPERDDVARLCQLVVLVARGDVPGLVAARSAAASLAEVAMGLVLRRGDVPAEEAADLVGVPLLGELPALGGPWPGLDLTRPPGGHLELARGVLAGVGAGSATDIAFGSGSGSRLPGSEVLELRRW